MKLSKADLIAVSLSGTMAFASTSFYLVDQPKSTIRVGEKPVGLLIQKRRIAERKSGEDVIWEEVATKSSVYNGDSIRTAKNSEATLKLEDGTDLLLEQDSLIVLSMDEDGMNINFAHGSLSAKRSEHGGVAADSKLRIKSGDKVVKIEKSDVSIAGGENKVLTALVTKGTAEVTSGKEKVTVKQDEKATVSEKVEVKLEPLRLRSPEPGVRRIVQNDRDRVRFEWQGNPGDSETLEISERQDFSTFLVRRPLNVRLVDEEIPEGSWYWRVKSKNEVSESRGFSIIRDRAVSLMEPRDQSTFTYSEMPPLIALAWSENPLANGYEIVVSRDPEGNDLVKTLTSDKNRISLSGLGEGDYTWRVLYNINLPGYSQNGKSPSGTFRIRKEEVIPAAKLTSPENKTAIRRDQLTNTGLSLVWSGGNERRTDFNLVIARDAALNNTVLKKDLALSFFQLTGNLEEGTYFWAVEKKDRNGKPLLSEVRNFTVTAPPPPKPVETVKKEPVRPGENAATPAKTNTPAGETKVVGGITPGAQAEQETDASAEKPPEAKVKPRIVMSEVKAAVAGEKPVLVEKKIEVKPEIKVVEKRPEQVVAEKPPEKPVEKKPDPVVAEKTIEKPAEKPIEKKPTLPEQNTVQPLATFRLRLEPEDAVALLTSGKENGKRMGKREEVVPGNYSLLVSRPGYLPVTNQVTLKSGEVFDFVVRLLPEPAAVKIDEKKMLTNVIAFPAFPVLKPDDVKEEVVLLDGTKVEGRVVKRDGDAMVVETDSGVRSIPTEEIAEIKYVTKLPGMVDGQPEPEVAPDKLTFVDDRIVYGRVLERKKETVKVMTLGGVREYRLDQITSIDNRVKTGANPTSKTLGGVKSSEPIKNPERFPLLDGSVVEGEVISERSGKIRIRTSEGIKVVSRAEIDRVSPLPQNEIKPAVQVEPDAVSAPDKVTLLNDKIVFGRILEIKNGNVRVQSQEGIKEIPQSQVVAMENRSGRAAAAKVSILTNATRFVGGKSVLDKVESTSSRWALLDGSVVEGELIAERDGKLRIRTEEGVRVIARSEIERVLSGKDGLPQAAEVKTRNDSRDAAADQRMGEIILLDDTVIQARILSQTADFVEILTGRGKRQIPFSEIKKIVYPQK